MALDWKYFTLRPGIKNLPLNEQMRLFKIANEKSINYRKQLAESFTDMSTSTLKSGRAGGPDPSKYKFTNPYCFEFDGNSDSVQIAGSTSTLNLSGEISISAWITLDEDVFNIGTEVKDYHIVDKLNFPGDGTAEGYALFIKRNKDSGGAANTVKLRALFGVSGTGIFPCTIQVDIQSGATNELTPNTPYNIIATYNPAIGSGQMKLYIDGNEVQSKDIGGSETFVPASSERFIIGNASSGPGIKEYHGKIDEVSIWNTLLDAEAITDLQKWDTNGNLNDYSAANGLNLAAWYRMGENAEFESGNWTLKSATDPDNISLELTSVGMVLADRKSPGIARDKS